MPSLAIAELLEVWERGLAQPPVQRGLALLALAHPETPRENLARFTIGQRNASLLKLREQIFGAQLVSLAKCGRCSEQLELTFAVAEILTAGEAESAEALAVERGDYTVRFRLPNSEDLMLAAQPNHIAAAQQRLFERCVLQAQHHEATIAVSALPIEVRQEVAERMAQADPQADVQLALTCARCGQQTQVRFDVVSFLWNEINAWACRLLQQVHILASAYGWREAEILAMHPWRRQLYLEMIRS